MGQNTVCSRERCLLNASIDTELSRSCTKGRETTCVESVYYSGLSVLFGCIQAFIAILEYKTNLRFD
jgi:hypothetical protein